MLLRQHADPPVPRPEVGPSDPAPGPTPFEDAPRIAPTLAAGTLSPSMEEIGLFPLDIVLVPGERLPLHIFEDRYRELIAECLENSTEFGLIFRQGVALSGVGTRAEVHDVLRRYPDGRLDIVVVGGNRFRLVEETEGRSFVTARVFERPEESGAPQVDDPLPPPLGDAAGHPQPDHVEHEQQHQRQLGHRRPPGDLDDVELRGRSEGQVGSLFACRVNRGRTG